MKTPAALTSLAGALGVAGRPLVALVGAGGKSTALRVLTEELSVGGSVIATTTTMMLQRQLGDLGPLLLEADAATPIADRAAGVLRETRVVALAHMRAPGDKVTGLTPAVVDALWERRLAEAVVVEADGSRGLPLKAFGADEPQVPARTTVSVVLAGLDAIGGPLDGDHVHRAGLLTAALDAAPGEPVTPQLMGHGLALQVARVRVLAPSASVVVLLTKADGDGREEQVLPTVAALGAAPAVDGRAGRPDRVVAGGLTQRTYTVVQR